MRSEHDQRNEYRVIGSAPARLEPTDAVSAFRRHIGLCAQRKPDLARRDTGIQCLYRRTITERIENEIGRQRRRARTEFVIDRAKELTAPH
jgi:hypothetical protein